MSAVAQKTLNENSSNRTAISDNVDVTEYRSLGLTRRECEVMHWIIEGKRDREIGIILDLSHRTVSNHAHNIFQKLHVETRTAAVRHYTLALSPVLLTQLNGCQPP